MNNLYLKLITDLQEIKSPPRAIPENSVLSFKLLVINAAGFFKLYTSYYIKAKKIIFNSSLIESGKQN